MTVLNYDTIIVGGGIAGLTATAYSAKEHQNVLLLEQSHELGGLVSSFQYNGFTLDGGIRSIENSGIVFPMLKQLGIDVPFERSVVSLGIANKVIRVEDESAVNQYKELLMEFYPEQANDIGKITDEITKIMKYMDILYGIDNPLFLDFKEHKEYYMKTIFPWVFRYIFTVPKVNKRRAPVDEYLASLTNHQPLIDMIGQHFFKKTPAFFALSYFSLYLDYNYPKGGTGTLINKIVEYIKAHKGQIQLDTKIVQVDPSKKTVTDAKGNTYQYKHLIWAADQKALYNSVQSQGLSNKVTTAIESRKQSLEPLRGGDSVLTSYLFVNQDSDYFDHKNSGHFFYTPRIEGLSHITTDIDPATSTSKEDIKEWLREYFIYNTFEISIPSVRDRSLSPKGKTALICSVLLDYDIVKHIADMGWYDEFKTYVETLFIDVLDQSIYPGLKPRVFDTFSSTPLTIEKRTGNTDGAITGWAFTNSFMPAVNSLPKIASSVKTNIPHISHAGQWSYSPAGLPISILTGKLAADRAKKQLKKQ